MKWSIICQTSLLSKNMVCYRSSLPSRRPNAQSTPTSATTITMKPNMVNKLSWSPSTPETILALTLSLKTNKHALTKKTQRSETFTTKSRWSLNLHRSRAFLTTHGGNQWTWSMVRRSEQQLRNQCGHGFRANINNAIRSRTNDKHLFRTLDLIRISTTLKTSQTLVTVSQLTAAAPTNSKTPCNVKSKLTPKYNSTTNSG